MSKRLPCYKGNAVSMTPLRDFRRPARLALPARGLALLAFFALTSSLAGPLWAATGNVSNLNLTPSNGVQITEPYPSAQGFTTGDDSAGYTLQSVTLPLARANANDAFSPVELRSVSSGNPGTTLATLTGSRSLSATMTEEVFTCSSGCELSGDGTSYFIVFTPGRFSSVYWGQNTAGTETNTPSNADWSIADDTKFWNNDIDVRAWESEGAVKLMKVT